MKREDFIGVFLGFIVQRTPSWLAEEDTEENHIANMQKHINDHTFEIKKVMRRNNRSTDHPEVTP